jgi:hypothetical protein
MERGVTKVAWALGGFTARAGDIQGHCPSLPPNFYPIRPQLGAELDERSLPVTWVPDSRLAEEHDPWQLWGL